MVGRNAILTVANLHMGYRADLTRGVFTASLFYKAVLSDYLVDGSVNSLHQQTSFAYLVVLTTNDDDDDDDGVLTLAHFPKVLPQNRL